jgi:hypothetical protein
MEARHLLERLSICWCYSVSLESDSNMTVHALLKIPKAATK